MASVRRSLFTSEAERLNFLNRLVNGSREILRTKQVSVSSWELPHPLLSELRPIHLVPAAVETARCQLLDLHISIGLGPDEPAPCP